MQVDHDITLKTTPDGRLICCQWCDMAVDTDGNPVKLVTPKHQIELKVAFCDCNDCKQQNAWANAVYSKLQITLSPSVCQRIMAAGTVKA